MLKNMKKLSNYKEVKRILAKYNYNKVNVTNIEFVDCKMDIDENLDVNERDIIKEAINEIFDENEIKYMYNEECKELIKYSISASDKFFKNVRGGKFRNENEVNEAIKEITGFKILNVNKITGYLVKHNKDLKANEKAILRGYLICRTDISERASRGYRKYLNSNLNEYVLDEVIDDLNEEVDSKINKIKNQERKERKIFAGAAATFSIIIGYYLITGSICIIEALPTIGMIGLCLTGIAISVKRFGRKLFR